MSNNPCVYLAGPVEKVDTWRKQAAKKLAKIGLRPINPLRKETISFSGAVCTSGESDRVIVTRDLNDLKVTGMTGGLCLMKLDTTAEGRQPIGSLFELQYCYDNTIPVVAVMGTDCNEGIRTHPWVRHHIVKSFPTVEEAIDFIENYFAIPDTN